MEGFKLNQEASKAERVDTELQSQSAELVSQVESLPALARRSFPGFKRIIATSILSLAAIGCEKQVNSAEKKPGNNNWIVMEEKGEKISNPTKWLGLPVQEVDGNYFINIGDGTYKLSASDMSELYKFKKGQDEANIIRRQINNKFNGERSEKLERTKPVERKGVWAPGSNVDRQTIDSLAKNDKEAHAQNLERHEKNFAELEDKKSQNEEYIYRMTTLAIEEEIKRLGERQ